MNIVYITHECYPFTQSSSLGDLVCFLSREIENLGNNTKVFMPRYGFIDPTALYIERIPFDFKINFNYDGKVTPVLTSVYKGILPDSLTSIYFIESQNYFINSKEIYLGGLTDSERFQFLCQASLDIISKLKMEVDLFHLFSPFGTHAANLIHLQKNAKTISTLTTLCKNPSRHFVKSLVNSDLVTTVSTNLLEELLSGSCSKELSEILKQKKENVQPIFSGIEESVFNPETDNSITLNYSKAYFTVGKKKCKESIVETFDLDDNSQIPLFSVILKQNLSEEEENILYDLFLQISNISNINIMALIPSSTGRSQELAKFANRHRNIKIFHSYSHDFVKKLLSGSDFFINLNSQEYDAYYVLISLKYGAVPICYKSGVISNLIIDADTSENGNGFIFNNYDINSLWNSLNRGLRFYKNKERWTKIVKEAMNIKLDKNKTIKEYIKCYKQLLPNFPILVESGPLYENDFQRMEI